MKLKVVVLIVAALMLFLTACGANNNEQKTETVSMIDHIHGAAYSTDGTKLFLATHDGLLTSTDNGSAWTKLSEDRLDYMGFNRLSDGVMVTSGHPGPGSNLPNPVGVLRSDDEGVTWEKVALTGKVDFHILIANSKQPDRLYGLIQMGEGAYSAGFYTSADRGKNWTKVESRGLPEDLHTVFTLFSAPENPDFLLAGTEGGVLKSEDGGETWTVFDPNRIITAIDAIANPDAKIISYSITPTEAGMMTSSDGVNWEKLGLDLSKDAVQFIAVNPKNNNEFMVSTFAASVYITKDGGKNWTLIVDKGKIASK